MVYALSFVVLLLAAAVVALFAMLGELFSRMGPAPEPTAALTEAKVGESPDTWPVELAGLATARDAVLLVLSTACASCNQVAAQLRDQGDPLPSHVTGVALSTVDAERAEVFMRDYGLPKGSVYVDVGGRWVTGTFGVQTSPSALLLRDGQLISAVVFTDLATLRAATNPTAKEAV